MPGRGSTTGGTTGSPSNELFPPRRVPARIGPIAVLGRKALRRVGRGRLVNEAGIGTLDSQLRQSLRSRILATHAGARSEEPTSELQSLMRISYAFFYLKNKTN